MSSYPGDPTPKPGLWLSSACLGLRLCRGWHAPACHLCSLCLTLSGRGRVRGWLSGCRSAVSHDGLSASCAFALSRRCRGSAHQAPDTPWARLRHSVLCAESLLPAFTLREGRIHRVVFRVLAPILHPHPCSISLSPCFLCALYLQGSLLGSLEENNPQGLCGKLRGLGAPAASPASPFGPAFKSQRSPQVGFSSPAPWKTAPEEEAVLALLEGTSPLSPPHQARETRLSLVDESPGGVAGSVPAEQAKEGRDLVLESTQDSAGCKDPASGWQ